MLLQKEFSSHYVAPAPGASCRVSNPGISVLLCVNWRFHKANYFGRPNRSTPQIKQMPVVKTSRLLEKIITGGPSFTRPPLTRFILSQCNFRQLILKVGKFTLVNQITKVPFARFGILRFFPCTYQIRVLRGPSFGSIQLSMHFCPCTIG